MITKEEAIEKMKNLNLSNKPLQDGSEKVLVRKNIYYINKDENVHRYAVREGKR